MKMKIAVIDDDVVLTQGLRVLLSEVHWLEWVGSATGIAGTLPLVRETRPDVVLMDVMMPGGNGILLTQQILEEFPDTIVFGCSSSFEIGHIERIQEAGARGYSLKEEGTEPILKALEAFRGRPQTRYLSPRTKQILLENNQIAEPNKALTEKEIQVLELKCEGYCNKEVAVTLKVGPKAVYKHIEKIKEKAGTKELLQLYPWAVKKGYLASPKAPL